MRNTDYYLQDMGYRPTPKLVETRRKLGKLIKFWRSESQGWVGLILDEKGILQEHFLKGRGFLEGDIYDIETRVEYNHTADTSRDSSQSPVFSDS